MSKGEKLSLTSLKIAEISEDMIFLVPILDELEISDTKYMLEKNKNLFSVSIPQGWIRNLNKPKLINDLYAAGLKQLVVSMYDGPQQKKYFFHLFKKSGISKEFFTLRARWYDKEENYGLIYTNRAGSLGTELPSPEKRACYYPHYALYLSLIHI